MPALKKKRLEGLDGMLGQVILEMRQFYFRLFHHFMALLLSLPIFVMPIALPTAEGFFTWLCVMSLLFDETKILKL